MTKKEHCSLLNFKTMAGSKESVAIDGAMATVLYEMDRIRMLKD